MIRLTVEIKQMGPDTLVEMMGQPENPVTSRERIVAEVFKRHLESAIEEVAAQSEKSVSIPMPTPPPINSKKGFSPS